MLRAATCRNRCSWYILDPKFHERGGEMIQEAARQLESRWSSDERWRGIERTYTAEQVVRLRGSVVPEHTIAKLGAERLWELIHRDEPVRALGALTGGQAVQMVRAGLEAVYLSGWQGAAAADVCGVPTVLVARTDALSAALLTSDVDEYDRDFVTGERTAEGFYRVRDGIDAAISRGLAYAPYADLVWFETSTPDLGEAREFAEAIPERFPGKPLAYNCSPSFNWRKHLDDDPIASFQDTLGEWGYRFLFITLAGFHSLNAAMFELASGYAEEQMPAYVRLQQREFELEEFGYTATRHQHEVGAGYFDLVTQAVAPGSETLALKGSTEEAQFTKETAW